MSRRNSNLRVRRAAGGVAALASTLMLAGCNDYLARRDSVAASAGNSLAANSAIQTIDPWPRRSFTSRQSLDGVRASQAMELYRTAPKPEPSTPAQSTKP